MDNTYCTVWGSFTLTANRDGIEIQDDDGKQIFMYDELESVKISSYMLFRRCLTIRARVCEEDFFVQYKGFWSMHLNRFMNTARKCYCNKLESVLTSYERQNSEVAASAILSSKSYIRHSAYSALCNSEANVSNDRLFKTELFKRWGWLVFHDRLINLTSSQASLRETLATGITEHNRIYCEQEVQRFGGLFDTIEKYPLTNEQRAACVEDDDANLVIAGAGTGKTSVVMGRVAYLLMKGCRPEDILVLAFNKKAADEIKGRLCKMKLSENAAAVNVSTFHSLGYNIIADATNVKPTVSELATNDEVRIAFLNNALKMLLQGNTSVSHKLVHYFSFMLNPIKTEFDFSKKGEYFEYLKSCSIETLADTKRRVYIGNHGKVTVKRENVKSLQECAIANFLFLNGVNYEYERQYEYKWCDRNHRQYKPDFYLLDYGIYIEHFGIDREGNTASFVDRVEYNKQIKQKRNLHRANNTVMIETYSYEHFEGIWEQELTRKLKDHGVKLRQIAPYEFVALITDEAGKCMKLTLLVNSFLNLFESQGKEIEKIRELWKSKFAPGDLIRYNTFLDIFVEVYRLYQQQIKSEGAIDFHMMIKQAAKYIENRRADYKYKYVIIDEYQDFALDKLRLIKAILGNSKSPSLFCVGDDWQSIYRFTGADVSLMLDFEKYWGCAKTLNLNHTFRYPQEILSVSSAFIQRSPKQIKKTLNSSAIAGHPCVHLVYHEEYKIETHTLRYILSRIQAASDKQSASVLMLGRYHRSCPSDMLQLKIEFEPLSLQFLTIHTAKGLEADYVIILDNSNGNNGFPCNIMDDPILETVLAGSMDFEYAEERRLFYVALTRARKEVFLAIPEKMASTFVKELDSKDYMVDKEYPNSTNGTSDCSRTCPECGSGTLVQRSKGKSVFLGCTNYPYCGYMERINQLGNIASS